MFQSSGPAIDPSIDVRRRTDTLANVVTYTQYNDALIRDTLTQAAGNVQRQPILLPTFKDLSLTDLMMFFDVHVENFAFPTDEGKIDRSVFVETPSSKLLDLALYRDDYRLVSVFRFIKSFGYFLNNLGLVSKIKCSFDTDRYVIDESDLGARSLLHLANDIDDDRMRTDAMRIRDRTWIKREKSRKVPDPFNKWSNDIPAMFERFSVPLCAEERRLYSVMERVITDMFMDFSEFEIAISLFSTARYPIDRSKLHAQYALNIDDRFPIYIALNIPPEVFTVSPIVKYEMSRFFESQITVEILLDSSPGRVADMRIALGAAPFSARAANRLTGTLSAEWISTLFINLITCAFNPNIATCDVQLNTEAIYDTTLLQILMFQAMVSCHLVRVESRVNLNNYVAYILVQYCINGPVIPQPFNTIIASPADWFNPNIDRMIDVYHNLPLFTPAAREFIHVYVGRDRILPLDGGRISTLCETVWGGGATLTNPDIYRGDARLAEAIRKRVYGVIVPYSEVVMNTFGYETILRNKMTLAINALLSSRSMVAVRTPPVTVSSYGAWMIQNIGALRSFINSYRSNLNRMLLSVGNDYRVRTVMTPPAVYNINLNQIPSTLLYVNKDSKFNGPYPFLEDTRVDLTVGLALFGHIFMKFEECLGAYREEYKLSQRVDMVLNEFAEIKAFMSPTLRKWFEDSSIVKPLISALKRAEIDGINGLLQACDQLSVLMTSPTVLRSIGYREYFYLTNNPCIFRQVISGMYVLATNAIDVPPPTVYTAVWNRTDILRMYYERTRVKSRGDYLHLDPITEALNALDPPVSAWEMFGLLNAPLGYVIRINYPCIINNVIVQVDKPTPIKSTKFDIDELVSSLKAYKPVEINMTLQTTNVTPLNLRPFEIDGAYTNTSGVAMVCDCSQSSIVSYGLNDYLDRFTQNLDSRKRPYVTVPRPQLTFGLVD